MFKVGEKEVFDSFFDEEFIMKLTGFGKKTVDNLRSSGSDRIPRSIKIGTRWVYPKKDFSEWAKKKGLPILVR